MTPHDVDEILRNAAILGARYHRKCWWADEADLRQEAIAAQLQAHRTYDATWGVPFGAYAWRAAALALRDYLLAQSAPVSARRGHREVLVGLHHAPIEAAENIAIDDDPRKAYERAEQCARVQTEVAAVLTDEAAVFAWATLGGDFTLREVTAYHGCDPSTVYRATAQVRKALRASRELYTLCRQWEL